MNPSTNDLTEAAHHTGRAVTPAAARAATPAAILATSVGGVWQRLDRDETGAQAMEYAALAGGGCGVVGILIALLQSDSVQSRLANLLTSLFDQLGTSISGLLGF
ncbi:MAG TPA: DUF4244 domain-containing protein [Euzebya sp.]|nr:DUF4244 domain-containing protein [Euzebya sp.]